MTRPPDLERALEAYANVSAGNRARFDRLKTVLERLRAEGIGCLLLKGADVLPRLHGALGARDMTDVDLLLREQDLLAVDAALKALGYRTLIDGNPVYLDHDRILALDIVSSIWYLDDPEPLWQRAVRREIGGIPVLGMAAGDLLVYLAAYNVVQRGYLNADFARDIALLVKKENVDWDFVVAEAKRRHLKIPIHHGLAFVSAQCPQARIPEAVISSLAPSTWNERILHWFFKKLVTDEPVAELGHLLLFLTRPGLEKWRWLKERLFPPDEFLRCRYGGRWKARPYGTRLVRPFYLLSQAARLLIRIARRRGRGPQRRAKASKIAFYRSQGSSMEPFVLDGDELIVNTAPGIDYRIGDIVVYRSADQPHLIAHRLVRIDRESSTFVMRADACLETTESLSQDAVLGRVEYLRRDGALISIGERS